MMPTSGEYIRQAAALPLRKGRVCLITSRNGKRWVIPKGWIEPGQTAGETALQEAWEEAGLIGILEEQPVGSYHYKKSGEIYHVTAFVMQVTEMAGHWPEAHMRQRIWVAEDKAHKRIEPGGLRDILRKAQMICASM